MNWSDISLRVLGLTPTEKAILEVLKTAKSIPEIVERTRLSRTGVNYCLKALYHKDLISSIKHGKRKLYIAVTWKELAGKLQHTIDDVQIENKDKKGLRIRTSLENEFIIHIGLKEIIPAYERIASMNKDERVKAIQHHRSYNELLEKITPKQLIRFNQAIIKNKIILDASLNSGAYKDYYEEIRRDPKKYQETVKSLEGRMADYTTFPDKFFNYDAEIWFFKTTTLVINWKEEVAIEITNHNMTGFLKDMFEFVKMSTQKIDHNQMMRNILEKIDLERSKK